MPAAWEFNEQGQLLSTATLPTFTGTELPPGFNTEDFFHATAVTCTSADSGPRYGSGQDGEAGREEPRSLSAHGDFVQFEARLAVVVGRPERDPRRA